MSKNKQTNVSDDNAAIIAELEAKIADLETQVENEKGNKLLARADLDNYRKRVEQDKAKAGVIANMQIMLQLLEIMDDIQLAKNDKEMDLQRAKQVMDIFHDKLNAVANSVGLEKVEIEKGARFDPATMEAITTIPTADENHDNKVAEVISSAVKYKGSDEVLKVGKVIVFKLVR